MKILVALILVTVFVATPARLKAQPEPQRSADQLPLKPGRHLRFDESQGTWMSLDISPDGKTIAFELLGDLYEMPVTGGEAHRIACGMPFDSQPVYSPDGKSIAFGSPTTTAQPHAHSQPSTTTPSSFHPPGRQTVNPCMSLASSRTSMRSSFGDTQSTALLPNRSHMRNTRRALQRNSAETLSVRTCLQMADIFTTKRRLDSASMTT
jgi:Tol biopolymer transport system component